MRFGTREMIFVGALLGLLAAVWFFYFVPAGRTRARLAEQTVVKQRALGQLREATRGVGDLQNKITELEQAIRFFQSKLPQEKEIDSVLKEVWQMAEGNSLQTRTIKTLRSERFAHYSEQPISLSLSGDFNGFYSFLLQLEKLPRIVRVTQMNLQKIHDRDGEMQAQLTMSIYFEPESAAAVAATR